MKFIQKVILIVFLVPITSLFSQDTTKSVEKFSMPKRGICAHRGANELHPENTIAAFKEAIRLGAQMIEFDVRMTKDNKLVVIHDESVDRTTNGTGLVKDLTWKEIKELDAGVWKSKRFEGEKIPSLKRVLAVFPKNIWLNVHLKGDEKLGKAVAQIIMDKKREHQVIIACTTASAKGIKMVNQSIKLCNMEREENRGEYISKTIKENFSTLQLLKKRNDSSFVNHVNQLKKHQVRINYYFSNSAEEGVELFNMGIDFILTDRLATMLKAAESIGISRSSK